MKKLVALVLMLVATAATSRTFNFAWDNNPGNPAGTTSELLVNGTTYPGITGSTITVDVPVSGGQFLDAKVRAILPPEYQCGEPLGPCAPSVYTNLTGTIPVDITSFSATKTWTGVSTVPAPIFETAGVGTFGASDAVVLTAPAGIVDNDILVARLYAEPSTQPITPPAGFTSAGSGINSTSGRSHKAEIFWKRASGESGNYTFTETGNSWGSGSIYRISGAITTGNPIDVIGAHGVSTVTGTAALAPGVTTTVNDTLLLYSVVNWDGGTYTPPSGMTEVADETGHELATLTIPTAGATGDKTGTLAASDAWSAVLIAIKPPAGASASSDVLDSRRMYANLIGL